jgi:selenide,water dikinase
LLTKPLGSGIVTTGIKRGLCPAPLARRAVNVMRQLNRVGADLAEHGLVRAGTDVTGFGLLGHLASLCRASGVVAEIFADQVPVIGQGVWDLIAADCVPGGTRQNLKTAEETSEFAPGVTEAQKLLLADAQTSGGLLLCVAPRHLAAVQKVLRQRRSFSTAIVGAVAPGGQSIVLTTVLPVRLPPARACYRQVGLARQRHTRRAAL